MTISRIRSTTFRRYKSAGFTLIELLVVISEIDGGLPVSNINTNMKGKTHERRLSHPKACFHRRTLR
jgi:hypothetical protein